MITKTQRYLIEISYHGAKYHGWQVQNNASTVQETVDAALSTLLRQSIRTLGCGRTDTGVHARQLFAHFDYSIPAAHGLVPEPGRTVKSLNALLPDDIAVKSFFRVAPDFHARFDATSRAYEYHIHFEKDPFLTSFSWQLRDVPDLGRMNEAARIMMGYRDFSCFSKAHTQVMTNNCEIYSAEWRWLSDGRLVFYIRANRFLRNMVRAIVGTLLEIGHHKKSVESIRDTIESQNRSIAGVSVPACGLYLTEVNYPPFLQMEEGSE